MPRNRDLKRLVRARMTKTGEAYTAARSRILEKAAPPTKDYAKLAGMSDASVKAKTGCAWDNWVRALDYHGAAKMSHREITALVQQKYKTGPWWTQTVAVGYERIKGLRAKGQQRNGTYEMTKSRTFNVPISALFEAWVDARTRKRWLNGTSVRVRTATAPKSMRLDWGGEDGGIVAVGFTAKGASKSAVALSHSKLPDRASATRLKAYWSERLGALSEVLARNGAPR